METIGIMEVRLGPQIPENLLKPLNNYIHGYTRAPYLRLEVRALRPFRGIPMTLKGHVKGM